LPSAISVPSDSRCRQRKERKSKEERVAKVVAPYKERRKSTASQALCQPYSQQLRWRVAPERNETTDQSINLLVTVFTNWLIT
jgi:hypothetical protein